MKRPTAVLLSCALVAVAALALTPADAGGPVTRTDRANDLIDYTRHPTNSFRPGTAWYPYQALAGGNDYQHTCYTDYSPAAGCQNPFDIQSVTISTDQINRKINVSMNVGSALPARGAPVTALPTGFSDAGWEWFFQTTRQDVEQQIGTDCDPIEYNPVGQVTNNDRFYMAKFASSGTCASARVEPNGTSETRGQAFGTRAVNDTDPILTPPHHRADGWGNVININVVPTAAGTRGGFNNTPLVCQGGAPVCLDYELQWGQWEGLSAVSVLQDKRDAFNESQFSFSVSGTTLTASVPYSPQVLSGTDDDMLIDDTVVFPWHYGLTGDKITALVAQTTGTITVGSPTALCPGGPSFVPEQPAPINSVGYPQFLPLADGGSDCIRGVLGLVTILDWGPDDGFHLRAIPRVPGYAASATSASCRYPIGQRPGIALVLGSTDPVTVDASTSPFDRPSQVGLWEEKTGSPYGGTALVPGTTVGAAPNPAPTPINPGLPVGQNTPCRYTYVGEGLHFTNNNLISPGDDDTIPM